MSKGVLKDSEVDRIVLEYLRKRNFKDTLQVLELEIKATGGDAGTEGASALLADAPPLEGVLLATQADGNPAVYAAEYEKFAKWVDGSLEPYRTELSRLLYPSFVHIYLNMINLRATTEAHTVFGEYKPRFAGKFREEELNELKKISMREQLATNRVAHTLRTTRFQVRLSEYAYNMLVHHLQVAHLMLILGVINEHIAIEVSELPPKDITAEGAAMTAPDLADAAAVNQTAVTLQLLKDGIEQRYDEVMAQRAEEEAVAKAEDPDPAITKRQRDVLKRQAAAAKTKRESVGKNRLELKKDLPLPELPRERQANLLQEMEIREQAGAGGKPVSAEALPSAAFFTFVNTNHSLHCSAFTSDVKRVAAGFADSSVRLYNIGSAAANGEQPNKGPQYFRGHSGPVYSVDFAPDDTLLLSSSADGTIRLWSSELDIALTAYRGHMLPVWNAVFAPQYGYYFASGGADRTGRVWCTERSQPLRIFVGHQSDVDVVRWHPNCHYVATGSSDRTVRMWDVRTGNCVRLLAGHGAGLTSLSFSPDGNTLVSGDAEGSVIAWDLASARQLGSQTLHRGAVWSLAHSQGDGAVIASGGADCTVRLWNGVQSDRNPLLQPLTTWKTKATPVTSLAFTTRNLLLGSGGLSLQQPRKG